LSQSYILQLADRILLRAKTRNPYEIANNLGIHLMFTNLGSLNGFYKLESRNRFIVINSNLPDHIQRLVCAHEIGHDQIHRILARHVFLQEFMLYDMKSRPEYEANLFASEILLDDDDIEVHARMGYDFDQIARMLYTDKNLLAIKMQAMNLKGYNYNIPIAYKSGFLGQKT